VIRRILLLVLFLVASFVALTARAHGAVVLGGFLRRAEGQVSIPVPLLGRR
jgi:hypothetical protein